MAEDLGMERMADLTVEEAEVAGWDWVVPKEVLVVDCMWRNSSRPN